MSNHFTGSSLGLPFGDQRLDLCDLYAFQSPADPTRTLIILNANPSAGEFHPDALYRLNIDNDGDCLTDLAYTCVFSPKRNGRQTANVMSTVPAIRRLAASSTPTTPRRNTMPASRSTTARAGSRCSST
jgi:hypothetical protein